MHRPALLDGGLRRLAAWLAALSLCTAHAAPAPDPDAVLLADRETVEQVEQALQAGPLEAAALADFRDRLLDVQLRAGTIAAGQAPLLQGAQARLEQLGAPPATGEAAELAEQRRALEKEVAELDARIKQARLLVVTSRQLADQSAAKARERFAADLLRPVPALPGERFRHALRTNLPADAQRLRRVGDELRASVATKAPASWIGALAAVAGAIALRVWLGRLLRRYVTGRAPPGRLRRSFRVLVASTLAMLVPAVVAAVAAWSIGPVAGGGAPWGAALVGMACFCGFVAGLGQALLAARRPSWRLLPLGDAAALRLRPFPAALAAILFLGWLLQPLAEQAQLSLPTLVALKALSALAVALVVARICKLLGNDGSGPAAARLALGLARAALALSAVAIVAGYVALGSFVAGQAAWTLVLAAGGYAWWAFLGDASQAWAAAGVRAGEDGGGPRGRQQAAVLVSGLLRLLLLLVLLVLLLAPFGEGPGELLGRGLRLREGVAIGELQLRPAALLQAIVVMVVVFAAARLFQRWTAERLLPTTSLDPGMRSTIVTLTGFLGAVLAVALGLSAMGLALTQVAWIASALTVGIGFGMQAVVSNFVSGLILLAERPVKVGDWVALGGLEGDIRRMNVRTTELQMADRSTVIVPNSEFITKVVRNVTHDSQAHGLVQVRLPLPLDTDTERVRATLLQALHEQEGILEEPAPSVMLEGIEGDRLVFSATGFVASPRRVAAARSELLFRVMPRLRAAADGRAAP